MTCTSRGHDDPKRSDGVSISEDGPNPVRLRVRIRHSLAHLVRRSSHARLHPSPHRCLFRLQRREVLGVQNPGRLHPVADGGSESVPGDRLYSARFGFAGDRDCVRGQALVKSSKTWRHEVHGLEGYDAVILGDDGDVDYHRVAFLGKAFRFLGFEQVHRRDGDDDDDDGDDDDNDGDGGIDVVFVSASCFMEVEARRKALCAGSCAHYVERRVAWACPRP